MPLHSSQPTSKAAKARHPPECCQQHVVGNDLFLLLLLILLFLLGLVSGLLVIARLLHVRLSLLLLSLGGLSCLGLSSCLGLLPRLNLNLLGLRLLSGRRGGLDISGAIRNL